MTGPDLSHADARTGERGAHPSEPQGSDAPGHTPHLYPKFRVRHRKSLLVAGLVFATCLMSWIIGLPGIASTKQFKQSGAIAAISGGVEFRADTSSVKIRPSDDGRVHVKVAGEYSGAKPMLALTTENERVLVVVDCYAEPLRKCTLAIELSMPANLPLIAKTSSGAFDVQGLASRVNLRTDDGGITLRDVSGSVVVTTLSGATVGSKLSGDRFTVSSLRGPVTLSLTKPPSSVRINSGTGTCALTVPAGTYRVLVDAGKAAVHVGVQKSPAAFGQIWVTTQDAPVRIVPAPVG